MAGAAFEVAVPDAIEGVAAEKFLVARVQADDRAALRSHQIVHGDAQGVPQPTGLAHDLVGGQLFPRRWPPQLVYLLHLGDGGETLHAHRVGAQAQVLVQPANEGGKVVVAGVVPAVPGGHRCRYSGYIWIQ